MSKRVLLVTAGVVLAAAGATAAVGGGAVMAVVGSDSTLATGSHPLTTSTSALVTPLDNISDRGVDVLGRPTLRTTVRGAAEPVFVGVGPAAEVDAYLAGAAVETVDDFELDPYELATTTRAGTARPDAPGTQSFWVARSDGASGAEVAWKLRGGDYRLVIMNADGSPGVAVDGQVALKVPHLFDIGATVLGVGVVLIGLGAALAVVGVVVTRDPGPAPVAPAGAPWVPQARRPETVPAAAPGDQSPL